MIGQPTTSSILPSRTTVNSRIRSYVFRHYSWLIPLAWVTAVCVLVAISKPENVPTNIVAAAGVALSLIYFIQKQSLEELELFERLFTRFNERYCRLHDQLPGVVGEGVNPVITSEQQVALDQYFNLCAEEYLFYSQGCILPVVWRSWCRGMLWYLSHDPIHDVFQREVRHDSHYGLTLPVIERGAGMRREEVN